MTETTTTAGAESNAATLKARFDALTARAQTAAESLQAAIPMTDRPLKAQEAFLLTLSDLQLIQKLIPEAQSSINGINLEALTPEQIKDADSLSAALAELAHDLIDTLVETFGVSRDIVMPTCIKSLERQLDLIEATVVSIEAGVAELSAA